MSKIIALVDSSIYAKSVCDHAAWIATRTGAAVELLHVLGHRRGAGTPNNLSGNIALGARSSLLKDLSDRDVETAKVSQKSGRTILDAAKAQLEAAGVQDVSTRLRIGDIVEEVAEYEADADLILIGKRGEAADFATLDLGSNLERIVRSSHKPVVVAARAFTPVKRFLIAFDGGPSSRKAVDHVATSPLFAGLPCRLLTVGPDTPEIRDHLARATSTLEAAGHDVSSEILQGPPDLLIASAVETDEIGLLVMGAYGHSRIRSLIIGSTTAEMIRLCKIPVMLFR
ncbi:MAG: nucleotide-binding universal stress UspA family protein [Paracoccaceae bacterium]|jgi:nucleotide-binding universal stress UspA family protein